MAGRSCSFFSSTITVSGFAIVAEAYLPDIPGVVVMTKPKERDGTTKYHVYRRVSHLIAYQLCILADASSQPIPLDLLTLATFTDPPTQRGNSILRLGRSDKHAPDAGTPIGAATSPESATDSRLVFPCTIHHNGRLGGLYTVFAESAQARNEWKQKLEEAIGLRKVVQDSNKVFEIETLSADTFLVPSMMSGSNATWSHGEAFTGKVTCSVPFSESCSIVCLVGHPVLMANLKPLLMAVALWRLDAPRACGLGSDTIHDVRILFPTLFLCRMWMADLTLVVSSTSCTAPEDGHPMCHAGRLRDLPCTRG